MPCKGLLYTNAKTRKHLQGSHNCKGKLGTVPGKKGRVQHEINVATNTSHDHEEPVGHGKKCLSSVGNPIKCAMVSILNVPQRPYGEGLVATLQQCWKMVKPSGGRKKVGHWRHALEGDTGTQAPSYLFLPLLLGCHVLSSFAALHTPHHTIPHRRPKGNL
jgi:hypothetical protein